MPESMMTTVAAAQPSAAEAYALGREPGESARLQRQSEELRPDSAALLDRVSLGPGQAAIDLGCGPRGILDLLAERVAPAGGWSGWTPTRPTSPWRASSSHSTGSAVCRSWPPMPGAPACRRDRSTWCMPALCW